MFQWLGITLRGTVMHMGIVPCGNRIQILLSTERDAFVGKPPNLILYLHVSINNALLAYA